MAIKKNEQNEDVSALLAKQERPSARRLLGSLPELLAVVFENVHEDDSLVSAACVSRTWGEGATAANWQRCWVDVRKLMMVLHSCNYYMTVRILQGEIEAGTLVGHQDDVVKASDEAREEFLHYCNQTTNLHLSMGVEENSIRRLMEIFPQNLPLLPRLKRVKADSQGDWTAAAPLFLRPSVKYLKMALHHPSDRILAGLNEFKNIKHLHLTYRARDRKIDFGSMEQLQTVVAEHVERASTFWENLSEGKNLREVEIRSTDGSVPESHLRFPSLQLLSVPAKDFILWTSDATAIETLATPTAVDRGAGSAILRPRYQWPLDQPTFPALRSLSLLQEARPLGIHLVKLLEGLRYHAPQLRELHCGHGKFYSRPKPLDRFGFRNHFQSKADRERPLSVELENGEQLGDDDFTEVAPCLGQIKELRLSSPNRVEALTPNVLATLAKHATSLNVLKLRLTVKEELDVSPFPAESFANLRDVDVHFDVKGSSIIPYATMLAHMCSSTLLERFSVTSTM